MQANKDLTVSGQHWRRNVKARPFVLTLRDHFTDKAEGATTAKSAGDADSAQHAHDKAGGSAGWTHQYVDVKYLQPIMDAIDDDGSGHVTIAEVNQFTELLPSQLGWR